MGSFVYTCSETKRSINEDEQATISFFIERTLFNQNKPHYQSSLPVSFATLNATAKDYGIFEVSSNDGLIFLEKFRETEFFKTTSETLFFRSIYDISFYEKNYINSSEDIFFSFLDNYKSVRYDETKAYSILSSLFSLKKNEINKDIIHYAFNGILYNALNSPIFLKFNNVLYSLYACIYHKDTISALKSLKIEDEDGMIVNQEEFINKKIQQINQKHAQINNEWFEEFDKTGTIRTPELKDLILSCANSEEVLILLNDKFKDEIVTSFLLKMGISTDIPSINTATQDYANLTSKSIAQQIALSFK